MEQKQSFNKNNENKQQIITNNELDNDINRVKTSNLSDDNYSMENEEMAMYQRTKASDFAFGKIINVNEYRINSLLY